jgi:hypothetical protein
MRVGELNALIDLVDGPLGQVDRLITMPALVRIRHPQVIQSLLQMTPGVHHMRLVGKCGTRAENGKTYCDSSGNKQPKLGDVQLRPFLEPPTAKAGS